MANGFNQESLVMKTKTKPKCLGASLIPSKLCWSLGQFQLPGAPRAVNRTPHFPTPVQQRQEAAGVMWAAGLASASEGERKGETDLIRKCGRVKG